MIHGFEVGESYRWNSLDKSDYDDCYCVVIKSKEAPDGWLIYVRWYTIGTNDLVMDQKNLMVLKSNLGEWSYGETGPH